MVGTGELAVTGSGAACVGVLRRMSQWQCLEIKFVWQLGAHEWWGNDSRRGWVKESIGRNT